MPPRTPTRRALLLGAGGALALAAGCLSDLESDVDPGSGSDSDSDPGSTDDATDADETGGGNGGENESDGDEPSPEVDGAGLDYDAVHFRHPETPTDPDAAVLYDRDDVDDWLAERRLEDDAVDAFVADVDLADARLVALEADAPNHCYEMVLETVAFDADEDGAGDGRLVLEAEVRDEAAENEMCAEARTTVGLLVRASVAGEPARNLSVRIVDDDGSEHAIDVTAASESDSGSADGDA